MRYTRQNMWTPEEDKIILDNLHLCYEEIAKLIGNSRTRNAVSGRCGRLGVKLNKRVNVEKNVKGVKEPVIYIKNSHFNDGNFRHPEYKVRLFDAKPNECRYTQQTGRDMMICGSKVKAGQTYCEDCRSIVYTGSQISE